MKKNSGATLILVVANSANTEEKLERCMMCTNEAIGRNDMGQPSCGECIEITQPLEYVPVYPKDQQHK